MGAWKVKRGLATIMLLISKYIGKEISRDKLYCIHAQTGRDTILSKTQIQVALLSHISFDHEIYSIAAQPTIESTCSFPVYGLKADGVPNTTIASRSAPRDRMNCIARSNAAMSSRCNASSKWHPASPFPAAHGAIKRRTQRWRADSMKKKTATWARA